MTPALAKLFDLSGRVALVTGGGRGLGRAMARGLAEAGADVILASRSEAELQAARDEISEASGKTCRYFVADLSRRGGAQKLGEQALAAAGRVDIYIHNAGGNTPQTLDEIDLDEWDRLFELNVTAGMALSQVLAPQMRERRWGRILHVSSIMALGSKEARGCYSATKAALLGLARAMALELGPHGVTVNCLAPGPFLTDMPLGLLDAAQQKVFSDRTALLRWGQPAELVGPALLLCSDAGSYVTGATLVVDGGVLCRTF